MVRYLLTAASALALFSGAALAQTDGYGAKTVTITRSAPHAMEGGRTITKKYINHRGMLVTKKKTVRGDGFYGSSVSRSKTVHDPMTGETRTRTMIER